jgi:hypothetical protein
MNPDILNSLGCATTDLRKFVFKIVAAIPMVRVQPGVEHERFPIDKAD